MRSCNENKLLVKNKKRGITFLILVITIVFVLIIATAITVSFNNIIKSTNKKDFANELNTLQKIVDQYKFMNNKYPISPKEITLSLDDMNIAELKQFEDEPGYASKEVILREINLVEAGVDNITRGVKRGYNELDIYTVSETTGKVYYLKSEKFNGIRYYTLTDELKNSLKL